MAIEQSIIDALKNLVSEFNAKEHRAVKAELRVPSGHTLNVAQGRGNASFGRHCVYDVVLVPDERSFRYYPLLQIKHNDGRPYPAAITFSEPPQEEGISSENVLKETVRRILNSDEVSQVVESLLR